jgi:hypothetical protein
MKKVYLVLVLLCLISIAAMSQDNTTNFSEKAPNFENKKTLLKSSSFNLQANLKSASSSWELQLSATCAIGGGEAGIETDGKYIYVTRWNSTEFYRYNMDGTYVSEFTIDGVSNVRDLAFDGQYFYGASASTTVFKMDFTEGAETLVGTINAPVAVRAIAYNDDLDAFYANNWSTDITLFDRSGTIISQGTCTNWDSYYGFAYDNVSEGGPYLWGFSQVGSVIVQLNAATYTETGFTFDVNADLGTSTGIAGGLFTSDKIVSGTFSIGGLVQNEKIFAYKLASYSAVCQDVSIYLNADGNASTTVADIDNGSYAKKGIASLSLNKSDFTCADAGENTVILTLVDSSSNISTCNATVTVLDTIAPEVSCQNIGITLNEDGTAKIYPSFINNGSSDASGIVSYSLDVSSFDCSDVGENTVVLRVKDTYGNVSTCNSTVNVYDKFAPTVLCQDIEVSLNAQGIAVIDSSMIDNGSTDMCGIAGMELSQTTFTVANLGENTVTLTVTDNSGNADSCQATIIVKDEIAPVAKCNSIDIWLTNSQTYELSDEDIISLTNGSSDNATSYDSLYIEITPKTFDCSYVGDTISIAINMADEAGNESSCEAMVYVNYTLPEQIDDIEINLAVGVCETTVDYPEVLTSVSCASYTLLEGLGAEALFPIGTSVETWEITYNNVKDSVSFAVIVTSENALPTLDSIANVTANEDETPVSVALGGISGGNDCVAQTLIVSATNTNTTLVSDIEVVYTEGDSTGVLNLTLVANQSGNDNITVVIEDSEGATISKSFELTIIPVNDAPVLVAPVSDQTVKAEATLELSLSKTLGDLFDDADGDDLTFSVLFEGDTLPSWVNTSEDADFYIVNFTPEQADTGCYNVLVKATDSGSLSASDTFVVCVQQITVGINDLGMGTFEVSMYPNPTKGQVTIETGIVSATNVEVAVMNIAGKEVFRKTFSGSDAIRFNLADRASGMYMVLIEVEGQRVVKKLVLDKN